MAERSLSLDITVSVAERYRGDFKDLVKKKSVDLAPFAYKKTIKTTRDDIDQKRILDKFERPSDGIFATIDMVVDGILKENGIDRGKTADKKALAEAQASLKKELPKWHRKLGKLMDEIVEKYTEKAGGEAATIGNERDIESYVRKAPELIDHAGDVARLQAALEKSLPGSRESWAPANGQGVRSAIGDYQARARNCEKVRKARPPKLAAVRAAPSETPDAKAVREAREKLGEGLARLEDAVDGLRGAFDQVDDRVRSLLAATETADAAALRSRAAPRVELPRFPEMTKPAEAVRKACKNVDGLLEAFRKVAKA